MGVGEGVAQGGGSSDAWHQKRYRAFTNLGHTRQEQATVRHFSNHLPRLVCFPSLLHNDYRAPSHLQRLCSQPHHVYCVPSTLRDLFQALMALHLDCICDHRHVQA